MTARVAALALALLAVPRAVRADGNCSRAPLQNTSFSGGDLKPLVHRHADSAAQCCSMCAAFAGCDLWTWVENVTDPEYLHVCWFKVSTAGKTAIAGPSRILPTCV